jgi:hypothetical protein
MRPLMLAHVAIALGLTATLAQAAGFRFIEVPADADGPALEGAMWYPCAEPPGEIELGKITLPGVKDCPIVGEKLPLVVICTAAARPSPSFTISPRCWPMRALSSLPLLIPI